MLGDKVLQTSGIVSVRRVVPGNGHGPQMETTIQETGTFLGVEIQETATYRSEMRPDGTLYGEGEGLIMGKNGEAASYKGSGVGRLGPGGSVSFRGALYYLSTSPAWTRANGMAVIFEHEATPDGKTNSQGWEWK